MQNPDVSQQETSFPCVTDVFFSANISNSWVCDILKVKMHFYWLRYENCIIMLKKAFIMIVMQTVEILEGELILAA